MLNNNFLIVPFSLVNREHGRYCWSGLKCHSSICKSPFKIKVNV